MKHLPTLRVGLVSIARSRFDFQAAREIYHKSISALNTFSGVEIIAPEDIFIDNPDQPQTDLAQNAVTFLRNAGVDVLIIQHGTFSMGQIELALGENYAGSIILWSLPEPDLSSGRMRLNSLVGLNLTSSHYYKIGRSFRYLVASPGDNNFIEQMGRYLRVLRVVAGLKKTRLIQLGPRAQGFFDLSYNEMELRSKLGVEIVAVGLNDVFDVARSLPESEVVDTKKYMRSMFDDMSEVTPEKEDLQARSYLAMRQVAEKFNAGAMAVRCWPEFPFNYGVAACSSVAFLNGDGIPGGCEGDMEGAITSLIMQSLGESIPIQSDVSAVDYDRNALLLWHNGCAALTHAATKKHLFSHFQLNHGLTVGFGMKPGRVTLARLGNDGHHIRMFLTTGEALPTEMFIRGSVSWVKTDAPVKKVLDNFIYGGWEHHLGMSYSKIDDDLREFAAITNIPLTDL